MIPGDYREGDTIKIGENILITLVRHGDQKLALDISTPRDMRIEITRVPVIRKRKEESQESRYKGKPGVGPTRVMSQH